MIETYTLPDTATSAHRLSLLCIGWQETDELLSLRRCIDDELESRRNAVGRVELLRRSSDHDPELCEEHARHEMGARLL